MLHELPECNVHSGKSRREHVGLIHLLTCYRIQAWILSVRVIMRCLVAESRLAASVFEGDFAEAAFTDVVASSLVNVSQFGEAIVLGRRCNPLTTVAANKSFESYQTNAVHFICACVLLCNASKRLLHTFMVTVCCLLTMQTLEGHWTTVACCMQGARKGFRTAGMP